MGIPSNLEKKDDPLERASLPDDAPLSICPRVFVQLAAALRRTLAKDHLSRPLAGLSDAELGWCFFVATVVVIAEIAIKVLGL